MRLALPTRIRFNDKHIRTGFNGSSGSSGSSGTEHPCPKDEHSFICEIPRCIESRHHSRRSTGSGCSHRVRQRIGHQSDCGPSRQNNVRGLSSDFSTGAGTTGGDERSGGEQCGGDADAAAMPTRRRVRVIMSLSVQSSEGEETKVEFRAGGCQGDRRRCPERGSRRRWSKSRHGVHR